MQLIIYLSGLIYFMMPAYIANMMPVFVRNIDFLAVPVDLGKKFKGKRLFGNHKTYRGLGAGVIGGIITAALQRLLSGAAFFARISIIDYRNWLLIGLLMGSGALIGDLVKSFFKRRIGVMPGRPWIPFDQVDFVIGALVFVSPLYLVSIKDAAAIILISFVLHIIIRRIGYCLKINKVKW